MPIEVECAGCGGKFRAPEKLAGKRVKCPKCSAPIVVGGEKGQSAAASGPGSGAALPRSPVLGARKATPQKRNTRLIVGLCVGAGVIVLVVLLLFLFRPSGEGDLADQTPTPAGQSPDGSRAAPPPLAPNRAPKAGPTARPKGSGTRSYPSYPDAVIEAPEWLASGAPFDVAKYLEAPPPEENAAPLYFDALFEFSADMAPVFSPEEQQRRAPAAREREQELDRLEQMRRENPQAVDHGAVDAWLARYEAGFEKLARAQQRPRCAFQTGLSLISMMNHLQASRQVSRVLQWRARRHVAQGDFDGAVRDVEMLLRLSRDLRPRGAMICQLVSMSLNDTACDGMVRTILTGPGVQPQHCDRLLAVLAEHEAEAAHPLLAAIRGEYLMARSFLHDLEHHTGIFDPQVSRGRQLLEIMAESEGKTPDPQTLDSDARNIDARLATMTAADFQQEREVLDRLYRPLEGLAGATRPQREDTFLRVDETLREADQNGRLVLVAISRGLGRTLWEDVVRDQTWLRATQCLIALRRWQLTQTAPPPDLAAVVKAAGMRQVPLDPYSDRPLLMTTLAGQPVVYSVGKDGKDDQARVEWDLKLDNPQGDILFRLLPPP